MRKTLILLAAALLCACSANVKKEAVSKEGDNEIRVAVEINGADVVSVSIDETEEGVSKKELGDEYGLKRASGIGKEWDEQIAFLESYLAAHGAQDLLYDAQGRALNADVLSGCTISIQKYEQTYAQALDTEN